jgi:hypothetical protein
LVGRLIAANPDYGLRRLTDCCDRRDRGGARGRAASREAATAVVVEDSPPPAPRRWSWPDLMRHTLALTGPHRPDRSCTPRGSEGRRLGRSPGGWLVGAKGEYPLRAPSGLIAAIRRFPRLSLPPAVCFIFITPRPRGRPANSERRDRSWGGGEPSAARYLFCRPRSATRTRCWAPRDLIGARVRENPAAAGGGSESEGLARSRHLPLDSGREGRAHRFGAAARPTRPSSRADRTSRCPR